MNISRLFIVRPGGDGPADDRPRAGRPGRGGLLPVSSLPDVDYPTIQVQTFYPGASPQVMSTTVTAPLEVQLGQIPGLQQMISSSSSTASIITLQFDLSMNLDCRRAGRAGGDQRRQQPAAGRPAGAADLREGQSGRPGRS